MTADMFEKRMQEELGKQAPLAARMRPRNFEETTADPEFIGLTREIRRMLNQSESQSQMGRQP